MMAAKAFVLAVLALSAVVFVTAKNNDATMIFIGNRQYEVENPHSVTGSPALHIYYHGHGGWCDHPNEPWQIADAAKAQGVNMLVIAPCGLGNAWDTSANGMDWTFTQNMIADVQKRYNVDPKKVTISGFSQGGMLSAVLACAHPETFVGSAMLNGAFNCGHLSQPINILAIEGANDNNMPENAYNSFAQQMGCPAGSGDRREQMCQGKLMQMFRIANGGHMFYEHDPIPFSDSNTIIAFFKRCLGGSADVVPCVSVKEHETASVGCAAGQVISSIKFADYGLPTGTCAAGFTSGASCTTSNATSVVRGLCLNKGACSVKAENDLFGDPCVTITKSLAISVGCAATCGTAAENAALTLKCADNTVIKSVDFASYGTPAGTCDAGFSTSSCHSSTSLSVLQTNCVGKPTCTVSATNAVFGDPCSGTIKTLAAKVTCA